MPDNSIVKRKRSSLIPTTDELEMMRLPPETVIPSDNQLGYPAIFLPNRTIKDAEDIIGERALRKEFNQAISNSDDPLRSSVYEFLQDRSKFDWDIIVLPPRIHLSIINKLEDEGKEHNLCHRKVYGVVKNSTWYDSGYVFYPDNFYVIALTDNLLWDHKPESVGFLWHATVTSKNRFLQGLEKELENYIPHLSATPSGIINARKYFAVAKLHEILQDYDIGDEWSKIMQQDICDYSPRTGKYLVVDTHIPMYNSLMKMPILDFSKSTFSLINEEPGLERELSKHYQIKNDTYCLVYEIPSGIQFQLQ